MKEKYSELLCLSSKLGFEPKKVDGYITFGGKQALGVCGINGLLYTDDETLVHEFVHVLQYYGSCMAFRFDDGEWCINDLPRFTSQSYAEVRTWVESMVPSLLNCYGPSSLPMEIPAFYAQEYYTNEEFLNGLIFLAKLKLGDS
jgi:hypothetical protein